MIEMVTAKQLKTMAKIFKKSGRTFKSLARDAGLQNIPDHANEITKDEADTFIKTHGMFLIKY
jgi:hypothetical protein